MTTTTPPRSMHELTQYLGLGSEDWIPYGRDKAKIPLSVIYRQPRRAKMVLVTATNPTPAGEGKTTLTIGLSQAFQHLGLKAAAALREPSLGPVFGLKGGATGGGKSQLIPAQDINLHFTGDFHAISSAHNLLAALIDNELYQGHRLSAKLRATDVTWKRVMDMNDRALRDIVTGLGAGNGVPRQSGFDITAASEVMAVLCLARDAEDLIRRLGRIVIGWSADGPATVDDLGAAPAMAALLQDALMPNLVQTTEGVPAFVHGGPFANIAHGTNSLLATEAALRYADIMVTEAGFGADLGAEKFMDIVAPVLEAAPDVVVLVTTLRSLKYQGGAPVQEASRPQPDFLARGWANLERHIDNLRQYHVPVVVAINRFAADTPAELNWLTRQLDLRHIPAGIADVFGAGGVGGQDLAQTVLRTMAASSNEFRPLYDAKLPLTEKIERIATRIYRARAVELSPTARRKLKTYESWGMGDLSVCMAKTPYSFSDDPADRGAPENFVFHVRDVELARGAGYIVPLAGTMVRMPGLPKEPAAYRITMDPASGDVGGLMES